MGKKKDNDASKNINQSETQQNNNQLQPESQPAFTSKSELQTAVDNFITGGSAKVAVLSKYGAIKTWNTKNITDMSELFKNKETFNEDISGWNTSNVTNMSYMFYAKVFNQPLNN